MPRPALKQPGTGIPRSEQESAPARSRHPRRCAYRCARRLEPPRPSPPGGADR